MRLKKFLFLPLLCTIGLTSCNNNNDPYKNQVIKDYDKITHTGDLKVEYKNNEKLQFGENFVVNFDDNKINYLGDKDLATYPNEFFFTLSNESPTTSRILTTYSFSTSKPKYETNFYIAVLSNNNIYVSKPIKITITNSNALNPVLYYVGGAFIIVAAAAIIYFAKRYKETH